MCVSALAPLALEQSTGVFYETRKFLRKRAVWLSLFAFSALSAAMIFISVPDMALVAANLSSNSINLVRSEVSGVIASVEVEDGATIGKGDLLFVLDTDQIEAQINIARAQAQQLLAEYEQASLASISEVQARRRMATLRGDLFQKNQQIAFLEHQKNLHFITAQRGGLIDLESVDDFVGVPVDIGNVLASIVDPQTIEVSLEMPVASATNVSIGDRVTFFPFAAPWATLTAEISRVGLTPEIDGMGVPIYKLGARLNDPQNPLALELGLGEAGRARIDSKKIRLGHYLLRRPLAWIRQKSGL